MKNERNRQTTVVYILSGNGRREREARIGYMTISLLCRDEHTHARTYTATKTTCFNPQRPSTSANKENYSKRKIREMTITS